TCIGEHHWYNERSVGLELSGQSQPQVVRSLQMSDPIEGGDRIVGGFRVQRSDTTEAKRPVENVWAGWPIYFFAFVAILVLAWCIPIRPDGHAIAQRRSRCIYKLRQIGMALHSYHDKFGSFPPAYIADENGRPIHSWRVLLLPYLGQTELYN